MMICLGYIVSESVTGIKVLQMYAWKVRHRKIEQQKDSNDTPTCALS